MLIQSLPSRTWVVVALSLVLLTAGASGGCKTSAGGKLMVDTPLVPFVEPEFDDEDEDAAMDDEADDPAADDESDADGAE